MKTILFAYIFSSVLLMSSSLWAFKSDKSSWQYIKGQPANNAFNFILFTAHGNAQSRHLRDYNNHLMGFTYNGLIFGTLINSYYIRSYFLAVSRVVYTYKPSPKYFDLSFGYRVGGLSGYKGLLNEPFYKIFIQNLAGLVPFYQLYADFEVYKGLGVEVSNTMNNFSLSFFYSF